MKTTIKFILLGIILSWLSSCNKKEVESVFPTVTTVSAKTTESKTIRFTGKLSWKSPGKINELGFIWQINDDPLDNPGFKLKLGSNLNTGSFKTDVANSLKKGSKYIVRAYALCGNEEIYGEKLEFIPETDLPIKLSEFKPTSGILLDTIAIYGKLFNNSLNYTKVKFDTLTSKIISVNDSVIQCVVPIGLKAKLSTIKVITNGIEASFSQNFTLVDPTITSIENNVKYGGILTISGHFINSGVLSVTITGNSNSYTLTPLSVTSKSIKVEIYNQQHPLQLLNLSSFTVRVDNYGKTINWDKSVAIASSWTKLTGLPANARYKSASFSLGGNIYIGGGASNGTPLNDFWKFDPSLNSWTRMADIPGFPRIYPGAASGTTNGFIGGGYSADNSSRVQLYDFYKYDPQANTWSPLPNYPDNIQNYYVGFAVTVNNRPFVNLTNQALNMREIVNNEWVSFSTVPDMIDCPASGVFSIGHKFYVVVGNRINNSVSNAVWEYNTDDGIWTKKSDFPGPTRYAPASFSIGKYGYYGCGMAVNSAQFSDMWRYDPSNDKWVRFEDFAGGIRSHLIGTSDGSSGFIGLGLVMSPLKYFNDFWKYDPR